MRRILSALETIEGLIATIAYALVATLLIGEIVAREIVGIPVLGARTIAVLAAIVAGFAGLSLATASGSHLRPAVLNRLLPRRFDSSFERASDLFAALVYFAIAWFAVSFVVETKAAGDRVAILFFPLWPIQFVLPFTFLSCATRHFIFTIDPTLRPRSEQPTSPTTKIDN